MGMLGNKLQSAYTATVKDTRSGDGSTTIFTLSKPSRTNDVDVFVENVRQEPTVAYSVSGTTLTFTAAPATGTDNIYVIHRVQASQSLTVNTDDITDGAITAAKIAAGVIPDAVIKSASAPISPSAGDLWYDTTNNIMNHWNGSAWLQMSNTFDASGGTESISGGYKYHTFTTSDTFTVSSGSTDVEYLIIGGGGGGGQFYGAGGGAGGLLNGTTTATIGSYSIVIGAGGGAKTFNQNIPPDNGDDSTAFGLTAIGGGGGGGNFSSSTQIGADGGSGGGTKAGGSGGGSGTAGQGNDGGAGTDGVYCGGGGGAGGAGGTGVAGTSAGDGGLGTTAYSAWATATSTGVSGYYASGGPGGGGSNDSHGLYSPGAGISLTHATANTGSGGSGGGQGDYTSAGALASSNGGSGIVIIRYAAS